MYINGLISYMYINKYVCIYIYYTPIVSNRKTVANIPLIFHPPKNLASMEPPSPVLTPQLTFGGFLGLPPTDHTLSCGQVGREW